MRRWFQLAALVCGLLLTVGCGGQNEEPSSSDTGAENQQNAGNQETENGNSSSQNGGNSENGTSSNQNAGNQDTSNQDTGNQDTSNQDTNGDDGPRACMQECGGVTDCGREHLWACEEGLCVSDQCSSDSDCTPYQRGWGPPCESADQDCGEGDDCVDVDGRGFCADQPDADTSCADMAMVEYEVENVEGETITVCGDDKDYECSDGVCVDPEFQDVDQCSNDADCEDFDNADTCYDGTCGCADESTCGEGYTCEAY